MQIVNFEEEMEKILERDLRYPREAYFFVREALDHTQKNVSKPAKDEVRHVTGQQLLEGIRQYALAEFGPMALTVLAEWNIQSCSDFGEIVFNMVENNLLAKTENDTREDFKGAYEFEKAFLDPFRPASKTLRPSPEPKQS